MEIRQLAPDDWRAFREIRLAALADAPFAFGSTLEATLHYTEAIWRSRLTTATYFVAVHDRRFVGLTGGLPIETNPGTALLISMWVAPEFRRRGVGEALVARVITWATEAGFTRLELEVTPGNHAAERLYERCGFIRIGFRADDAAPNHSNIVMERLL